MIPSIQSACAAFVGLQLLISVHPLEEQKAFMVVIQRDICTGTLIADDWVITAAHCFDTDFADLNVHGDYIVTEMDLDYPFIRKKLGSPTVTWTDPIDESNITEAKNVEGWRDIDYVISNGKFQEEALSWKGFDIALVKLKPLSMNKPEGLSAKICLPLREYPEGKMCMAGYGRRFLPHCFTDNRGPEKFAVCGRPSMCATQHRATSCGLEFLYNGTLHNECLMTETPSAQDPGCKALYKAVPDVNKTDINHIFDTKGVYKTTCYPPKPPNGSKGWCGIRGPGVKKNSEPTATSGWGFCSQAKEQAACNARSIPRIKDPQSFTVEYLDPQFCVEELAQNLAVEQPDVKREEFGDLRKNKVICVGRNVTDSVSQDGFYQQNGQGFKKVNATKDMIAATKIASYDINGGPGCFGDSGGPLWTLLKDGDTEMPVMVGVFSFMLWGTCVGRREPSFYGPVVDFVDWIQLYINKEDLCFPSKDAVPAEFHCDNEEKKL